MLFVGCASTPSTPSTNLQNAITAIHTVVPIAVQYAVIQDSNNAAYCSLVADVIDAAANGTNFNPAQLMADINAIPQASNSPEAKLVVVAVIGVYQGFFASQVTSNADTVTVLKAISASIRQGLGQKGRVLKPYKGHSKSCAWVPAAARPGAESTPMRVWNGVKAPWIAKSENGKMFSEKETTISLSGTYVVASPSIERVFDHFSDGTYGFNLATTYWLNKYIGTGIETGITDIYRTSSALFTYTGVTVAARLPIGPVAPYIAGVVGRNFDSGTYYAEPRAGVEVRVTPRVGLFADAGYVWQTAGGDQGMQTRFGVALVF